MMNWRDRRVLVTGATGLLGQHITEILELSLGAEVVSIIRDDVYGNRWATAFAARGDVSEQGFLERVMGEYEIQTVFHLAAQTIVQIANRNPISTFESNIKGTWCVLEAARRSPHVRNVVVASSDKAYGSLPYRQPKYFDEDPMAGEYPYDV